MRVLVVLFFLVLIFGRKEVFAQNEPSLNAAAKQWIAEKKLLVTNGFADTLRLATFEQREMGDYQKTSLRIFHQGRVVFGNQEEVYLFVNSSHTDSIIGDVTVLFTKTETFYFNRAHACGGMAIFYAPVLFTPKKVREFLTEFKAEADESVWEKYE